MSKLHHLIAATNPSAVLLSTAGMTRPRLFNGTQTQDHAEWACGSGTADLRGHEDRQRYKPVPCDSLYVTSEKPLLSWTGPSPPSRYFMHLMNIEGLPVICQALHSLCLRTNPLWRRRGTRGNIIHTAGRRSIWELDSDSAPSSHSTTPTTPFIQPPTLFNQSGTTTFTLQEKKKKISTSQYSHALETFSSPNWHILTTPNLLKPLSSESTERVQT